MKKATIITTLFVLLSCIALISSTSSFTRQPKKQNNADNKVEILLNRLCLNRIRYENKVTKLQTEMRRCKKKRNQ